MKPDDYVHKITEAELQRMLCRSMAAGQAAACESAGAKARSKAGELFGRGKDGDAQLWREVAKWLEELGVGYRKDQKKFEEP